MELSHGKVTFVLIVDTHNRTDSTVLTDVNPNSFYGYVFRKNVHQSLTNDFPVSQAPINVGYVKIECF